MNLRNSIMLLRLLDTRKTLLSLIGFSILVSSCRSTPPAIDVSIWAGDSTKSQHNEPSCTGAISRAQDGLSISASSPAFDDYACLSYADLKKIYNLILQCKEWPRGGEHMSTDDIIRLRSEVFNKGE